MRNRGAERATVTTPLVVREVAARMGCYKRDVREVLDHFSAIIVEQAAAGKKVRYASLGVFYPAVSRRGRGAERGERKLTARFKPARGFLKALNEKGSGEGDR